jgi:malonyl-CoA/methylmalonyl-CoA synthetase
MWPIIYNGISVQGVQSIAVYREMGRQKHNHPLQGEHAVHWGLWWRAWVELKKKKKKQLIASLLSPKEISNSTTTSNLGADRVDMASNGFPNDDIFSSLRSCADRFPGICINNSSTGISTSYTQLIQSIVATRQGIRDTLPASHFDNRGQLLDKSIWIGLQAPLSEDFIVGCLAILSVGGAIMPIAVGILQEEVDHFLEETKCVLLLTPSKPAMKPTPDKPHRHVQELVITCSHTGQCADARAHLQIDETLKIPSNRPGLILFTSGTTGPPKGAVLPRHALYPTVPCTEANRRVHLSDRIAHWIGGIACTLLPLLEGHIIQILKPGSSAEDYWELIKQQQVTKVIWGPTALAKLKQYYDDNFKKLTSTEIEPYVSGARAIQEMCVGSAMPPASLQEFWEKLVDAPLVMHYAATESGGVMSMLSRVIPSKVRDPSIIARFLFPSVANSHST